jgi:hypothetical protein
MRRTIGRNSRPTFVGCAMEPFKVHNSNKGPQIEGLEIDAHGASITPIFAFQSSFTI